MSPNLRDYDYNFCKLENPAQDVRIITIVRANPDQSKQPKEQIQIELKKLQHKEEYHALSWCWRAYTKEAEQPLETICILHYGTKYAFRVSANLAAAIRMLYKHQIPTIWIDWICIDQKNVEERSNQVQLMSSIYGEARKVIIWLGEKGDSSDVAFQFIPSLLNFQKFGNLIKDPKSHGAWDALKSLMMRDWFARRWIIQEIALAKEAEIFCGDDRLDWKDFADAISLFTLSETNNRVVSDIMKGQSDYSHMPNFFGSIAATGAARLVEVTDNLFRAGTGSSYRRPRLQNLEHLVSSFTPFKSSEARDTIYAILAIAKDTTPRTESQLKSVFSKVPPAGPRPVTSDDISKKSRTFANILEVFTSVLEAPLTSKSYNVDYSLPISDVFVEFVRFCIARAMTSDPTRALDIICRPWAPDPDFRGSSPGHGHWRAKFTWKIGYDGKAQKDENNRRILQSKRKPAPSRYGRNKDPIQRTPAMNPPADTLPSWTPSVEQTPFGWNDSEAGPRMTRQHPDSLVGEPSFEKRPYSASGSRRVTSMLRFEHGVIEDPADESTNNTTYHSLYVEGFVLGTVDELGERSQNGQIPKGWSDLVDCNCLDPESAEMEILWDRPGVDDFWRTLVGNRGLTSVNPPRCYRRILSTAYDGTHDVNLDEFIFYSKHDPAKALSRRIHAVIWDRRLMKLKKCVESRRSSDSKERNVGLAPRTTQKDDLVCILYGCSVPVILRKYTKSESVVKSQQEQHARNTIFIAVRNWFYRLKLQRVIERWRLLEDIFHCCVRIWFFSTKGIKSLEELRESNLPQARRLQGKVLAYSVIVWFYQVRLGEAQMALRKLKTSRGGQIQEPGENSPVSSTETSNMPPPTGSHKRKLTEDTITNPETPRKRSRSAVTPTTPSQFIRPDRARTPMSRQTSPDFATFDSLPPEPPKADMNVFYSLIGECYVHRMMDGEAIDYQTEERLPKVLFEIR